MLQVGDHDTAGEDIFRALAADVTAFLAEAAPEAKIEVIPVAMTPDQIAMYGLRPRRRHPVRANSRRTRTDRWHADGHSETCQAEALPPNLVTEIVDASLRDYTDLERLASLNERKRVTARHR